MSLNDLLPLLFVLAFVVNAVVRGRQAQKRREASRRRGGKTADRGGGSDPTAGPAREVRADTSQPARRPDARGGAGPAPAGGGGEAGPSGDSPGDDLMRRIEEARRRVREAMGESDAAPEPERPRREARPAAGGGGPSTPSPSPGALGHGSMFTGPRRDPDVPTVTPSFLGREGVREPPEPDVSVVQDAPRVARLGRRAGSARLRAAYGLGATPDDIARGFVWSVVFEEPVAVRMRRRNVSPRRSP